MSTYVCFTENPAYGNNREGQNFPIFARVKLLSSEIGDKPAPSVIDQQSGFRHYSSALANSTS